MYCISLAGGKAAAAVCSAENGDAIVKAALDAFGGVHILVANAGILRDKSFTAMTEAEWDAVIAVHLRGTYKVRGLLFRYTLYRNTDAESNSIVRESCVAHLPEAEVWSNSDDRVWCWHL